MNWQPLLDELILWQQLGRIAKFWLRDDDAIGDTPALQTFLGVTDPLPVAVAAIPANCNATLSARLAGYSRVVVFQHGWRHLKKNIPPDTFSEYPVYRDSRDVLAEIQAGKTILTEFFGSQFLPVMVPPYHGWCNDFTSLLEVSGFIGISSHVAVTQPTPRSLKLVNIHVVPIAWYIPPTLGDPDTHIANIVTQLQQRRTSGSTEPVGILTHHLSHDAAVTTFVDELAGILTTNPAVVVAHPTTLFTS